MSRLPHENRDVRGVEGPEYEPEHVCAHPFCDVRGRENLEKHELWPRSFLRGQPITHVQLWDGTIVGNQVYLCNAFQKGHHQEITENRSEIAWGDGVVFVLGAPEYDSERFFWKFFDEHEQMHYFKALEPQPPLCGSEKPSNAKHTHYGEIPRGSAPRPAEATTEPCTRCKGTGVNPQVEKKKEPAKQRATKSIRVPKEKLEDGADVLEQLIEAAEKVMRPGEEARPPYFTICDSLGLIVLHWEDLTR